MMTTKLFSILALILTINTSVGAQTKGQVHVGLIYPLSTNGLNAPHYSNRLSLHAIAGVSSSESGGSFAGIANVINDHASGIQCAGFTNIIAHNAHGAQFAGFLNYTGGLVRGAQFAGFANVSRGVKGAQFAGFANVTKDSATTQVAGFINTTHQAKAQLAGFINVAEEVRGIQLAGFINVAKKVKGVQLAGFLNIADSSDYPIGLINIVKNGEMSIGISTDETLTTLASFRSGGRAIYGILGAGINTKKDKINYALEAGLGMHIPVVKSFRVNIEATELTLTDFKRGSYLKSSLRILPALKLGNHLELFGGPSFNTVVINRNLGRDFVSGYAWKNQDRNNFTGLYFGAVAGLQWVL